MKVSTKQMATRNSQRVLRDFSQALAELLGQHAFEKITVNQLCETANYPRSTFYNYFEDKYDLLNYCWSEILQMVGLNAINSIKGRPDVVEIQSFDRLYDLLQNNLNYFNQVLRHNSDGYLKVSFHEYMLSAAHKIFRETFDSQELIPVDLLIDHCFSTVMNVLEWIFIDQHKTSKETAHRYLAELYGIQKII